MKRIFTVQHTQSEHHVNGMVGSWTDWDLTETGKRQAELIAENLARELKGQDVILYSSDLKRAKQTAGPIASKLGAELVLRPELRERNLGRCCGRSVQWLKENLERDEKTVDDRLFSDAESRRDVWNRLKPFFEEMMADEYENVVIVSHGDLLSVFNAMFLGLQVESLNTSEIFGLAGGVSRLIVRDDGKRVIRNIGDMAPVRQLDRENSP
ncbi:MAG: histidine phosphatase family protein [Clostridia bacterium]|nr:histidine phosphatase family protein [Clostridia bacterium]